MDLMGNVAMLTQEWLVVKYCSLLRDKQRKKGRERDKERWKDERFYVSM